MAFTDHSQDIQAFLTDAARNYTARALNGELAFRTVGFSVGRGGYNPANPVQVFPIDTTLQTLIDQVYPAPTGYTPFQAVDSVGDTAKVFNCRLPATQTESAADYGLGEIGIWAEILNAHDPSEIGTVFLYAVGHMPIRAKTRRDVFLFRVVVNY